MKKSIFSGGTKHSSRYITLHHAVHGKIIKTEYWLFDLTLAESKKTDWLIHTVE